MFIIIFIIFSEYEVIGSICNKRLNEVYFQLIKANKLVMRVRNDKAVMDSMNHLRYKKSSDDSDGPEADDKTTSNKPNLVVNSRLQNESQMTVTQL